MPPMATTTATAVTTTTITTTSTMATTAMQSLWPLVWVGMLLRLLWGALAAAAAAAAVVALAARVVRWVHLQLRTCPAGVVTCCH